MFLLEVIIFKDFMCPNYYLLYSNCHSMESFKIVVILYRILTLIFHVKNIQTFMTHNADDPWVKLCDTYPRDRSLFQKINHITIILIIPQ